MTDIRHSRLENGMIVLTEMMQAVETVSLGIWLPRGSRDEHPKENGMFHFIEHTLFKGTPTRSARAIAEDVDSVGAVLDAFTGKEETCYSIKVRDKRLFFTLEILADMLRNPLFDPEELARERNVILEEIKMEEDSPEDMAYELSLQHSWQGNRMGAPILGTREIVKGFNRENAQAFHKKHYQPQNLLVAAAGKVNHDQLCQWLLELFPPGPQNDHSVKREHPPTKAYQIYQHNPNLEQINFCLNLPGLSLKDSRRNAFYLLNTLLGGASSSRLFLTIREERGLAYSVGSFTNACSDSGLLTVYGGCSPENFNEVMNLTLEELNQIKSKGVTEAEVGRAREQFSSGLVMNLETTQGRASMLARSFMYSGEIFDIQAALRQIDKVSLEDVNQLASELLTDAGLGLFAIGRLGRDRPQKPWRLDS